MADTSKITLKQLKDAMNKAKNYTDNEIAGVTGVSKVEPEELDMPKVFFYGNALPTTKDNVNLTMDYISNTAKFSSFIKLKCQGTSSMSYAKKNFTVSMFSDESRNTKLKKDFKGWGPQSKFCLKANYVDTTHTRNLSGAKVAYDMVQSRPDSPFKQQLLQCPRNGAVDGFPIKLYFNGEFYGIYTWNIPKDGWMFNMDESNPKHTVLCAERNTDGNSSLINSCQFRKLWTDGDGGDWSVEFGTYSTDMVASLNRCINFVMTSTDQEFHDNIGNYFDLYSLLDYYCFSYLCCHLDGLAKNMLMATYDGVIWGACLYDMDSIYGVHWNGDSYVATNYQCPEQYQEQFSGLWPRIERCFATELYARYRELRRGALSLSNIIKHVEEIYDVIPDRVFADEKAKWTSLPQVNTNTMTRFRNYMRDRAVYVDAQMEEIGTRVPCTGIVLSADTLSFTTTDTQTLSVVVSPDNTTDTVNWSVSPSGIVTVNNGVITPIANGECTITVTCGSYNDTCSVTVSLPVVECTGITLDKNELAFSSSSSGGTSEETIDITQNTTSGYIIRGAALLNDNVGMSFGTIKESAVDTTTDFIPFTSNNTLTISQPSTQYGCDLVAYDNNKQALACYAANNTWEAGDTQTEVNITTSTVNVSAPPSNTAYIRICFNLTNLSDVTVVKKNTNNSVSSYQLIATVTPTNCTQPVVWGVDPTGIVTVNNGLVRAVTNGEATVTATCGSQSATCAVTVSGMIEDTAIYATAEYAITEPRTFNGTSDYIDTGIKLFDTAKTFTIFVDYVSNTPTPSSQATIFHCLHEEPPYRGLCLMEAQSSNDSYFIGGQVNTQANYISNMPSRGKYLISFVNGVINNIVTRNNSNELVYSATDMASANPYVQISENLLMGSFQDTSGTKGRYWSGTINKFGVWYKQLTSDEINKLFEKNGGDSGENANLVFQVNSASMNTVDNTLTDNIAGISATLTGNPTVSDNQIAFTANDKFSFDLSSLSLNTSNRTLRVKFTPTTLDGILRNVIGIGVNNTDWVNMTSCYVDNNKLVLQHGENHFANNAVGETNAGNSSNRLSSTPTINTEYEIVISENVYTDEIRWFVNGTLVQDGTTALFNPLYLSNTEGINRFIGSYSLIEIYNGYCYDYTEFTNMVNNASSGGESGENTNYLANASWQAGTLDITNNATVSGSIDTGSSDDRYASVQIPAGKYALRSSNATWKKFRLSDSKGTVLYYYAGENTSYDTFIDTTISDDTIFTLEVSYYRPNDTIEVPSLMITDRTNITTVTLDGSLTYDIPEWNTNPSGQNGQVNVEHMISGLTSVPMLYKLEGYTYNNGLSNAESIGLAKQYNLGFWNGSIYLRFTLDMAETGVTNDVESITNYLSSNPLTFKYVR